VNRTYTKTDAVTHHREIPSLNVMDNLMGWFTLTDRFVSSKMSDGRERRASIVDLGTGSGSEILCRRTVYVHEARKK
jgi:hypothetical protein